MESYSLQFEKNKTNLPPGFRFHPTDEEIISYYLMKKVLNSNFTCGAIAQVDLNKCEPWELPEKAKMGEKEWYFFSLRDRKYPTGLRTNRATEAGYWKATGKDRVIMSGKTSSMVGMKKTLVFYCGRAPKGDKSNWVMHEYRLEGKLAYHYFSRTSKDEWVIARVFQKTIPGTGPTTSNSSTTGPNKAGNGLSLYTEVSSSHSSVSHHLPPLLDSSPYVDDCRSFDNSISGKKEHVSCFSMINNNTNTTNSVVGNFNASSTTNSIVSNFNPFELTFPQTNNNTSSNFNMLDLPLLPTLKSLQENLTIPWVSGPTQMHGGGGGGNCNESGLMTASRVGGRIGASELDCMWTYRH